MEREIKISADRLIKKLVSFENVCLLDSSGARHLKSHLLIAGIEPREILSLNEDDTEKTLEFFDGRLSNPNLAYIFTISYDFGLKLQKIDARAKEFAAFDEPDIFLAAFDCLIVHDYDARRTFLTGNAKRFDEIEKSLFDCAAPDDDDEAAAAADDEKSSISSNFTRESYIETVGKIQENIRCGDTYQTNLTRQIRARMPENLTASEIFLRLRKSHPAPFAAFIKRKNDTVVSASPERFFKVQSSKSKAESRLISTSPIKGTRPRGRNEAEDLRFRNELLRSEKDRAENVMIVDLLRSDIGRICKFGSIGVEKLCDLETHPTLFHLVSTIKGELRGDLKFSDIIRAVFPCGSITGAPKISTMRIIDRLETAPRALSMGAIGYCDFEKNVDLSVAIRTMVVRGREAIFNVGGGIVIDSDANEEYEETLTKARALLDALGAKKDE